MKTKDFREIQVSSSLLAVIFLCVLALGVFIFLLGVSVGKKQVQLAAGTGGVPVRVQDIAKGQPSSQPPVTNPGLEPKAEPGKDLTTPTSPTSAPADKSSVTSPGRQSQEPVPKSDTKTNLKPAPITETPKTAAKPSPAVTGGAGLYYVQVAAFKDKPSAQAEADKYKKKGYAAVVLSPKPTDKVAWYRVRLGGFPQRGSAVDLLKKLNEGATKKTDYQVVRD